MALLVTFSAVFVKLEDWYRVLPHDLTFTTLGVAGFSSNTII